DDAFANEAGADRPMEKQIERLRAGSMRKQVETVVVLVAIGTGSCAGLDGRTGVDELAEPVTLSVPLTNTIGRVVSTGNGAARRFFSYDARGRSTYEQHVLDGKSYVYSNAYGFPCAPSACTGATVAANGPVVVSETFPDNEVVRYTFDAGGA